MKRVFFFILFLGVLGIGFNFHSSFGTILKIGAYFKSGSILGFERLQFLNGELVLDRVTLLKPDAFKVKSDRIAVCYSWPFTFSVNVDRPHLTLSPEILSEAEGSAISFPLEIREGYLDWSSGDLPSGDFSFHRNGSDSSFHIAFDQGSLSIENDRVECVELPLQFLERLAAVKKWDLPIRSASGIWSGSYDGSSFKASGSNLSFVWDDISCSGSFSLDWQRPSGYFVFPGTERLRISIDGGEAANLKNIHLLASYQAGSGATIECQANIDALPINFQGKGFFSVEEKGWIEGDGNFGGATAHFGWTKEGGTVEWEKFGVEEATALKSFAPFQYEWISGTVKGSASYRDALKIDTLAIEDLQVRSSFFDVGCKSLTLDADGLQFEGGVIDELELSGKTSQVRGSWRKNPVHLVWDDNWRFSGEIGEFQFSGDLNLLGREAKIAIAQCNGKIPDGLEFLGIVESGEGRASLKVGKNPRIEDWSISCKVKDGAVPEYHLSKLDVDLSANRELIEFSSRAILKVKNYELPIRAQNVRLRGEKTSFDVRLEGDNWDAARLVGSKNGTAVTFDLQKSHLLGSKLDIKNVIWSEGELESAQLETEIPWERCEAFLGKNFGIPVGNVKVDGKFHRDTGSYLVLNGADWKAKGHYEGKQGSASITIKDLVTGFFFDIVDGTALQLKGGHSKNNDFSFEFEGKAFEDLHADLILKNIKADLKKVEDVRGNVEGRGCLTLSPAGVEADLDLIPSKLQWRDFQFENQGTLHLFYSSGIGALVTGIEGRLSKGTSEAQATIELLEYDQGKDLWDIQKAQVHFNSDLFPIPGVDEGKDVDLIGSMHFRSDFSDVDCTIIEGLVPISGSSRALKDLHIHMNPKGWDISSEVRVLDKWAKVSLEMTKGDSISGKLGLQEGTFNPLSIEWTHSSDGFKVSSIQGYFGGVDTAFISSDDRLVGSANIDFRHLSNWVPEEVGQAFIDLEMGSGYELKGSLKLDPKDPSQVDFHGILTGKQFELFGFELRSLLADAQFNSKSFSLTDITVSDSAVHSRIDKLVIEAPNISMPSLVIENLRPSLLRKPGEVLGALSPLLVRRIEMNDFGGLVADGKTYTAKGTASFVNTFKREESVFDIPSSILGRIIGVDLDLLVPVIGDITFDLKDGFFWLNELKNAYSEGDRSEFFLVHTDTSPRIDLRGNLEVFVKMKHYVLFALTEGFLISIDGNLSKPKFRLQKKHKFL